MKILLIGRRGNIGGELEKSLAPLGEVVATDRAALDLTRPADIQDVVRTAKPQLIVNAAAYTAVDRAEAKPQLAMQVNGVAPGILGEEARRLGALLVHYSTDYVFDGHKRSPYTELDPPAPLNAYGRTKLEGERRLAQAGSRHLLLRTSWIYGPRGRNFFLTIARRALAREPIRVTAAQEGVPTAAGFIAEATVRLIAQGIEGTFNVVPSGSTTWHGFAQAIVARVAPGTAVEPLAAQPPGAAARRPAYSVLDSSRLSAHASVPPWLSLLDRCVAAWNPGGRCG